MNSWFVITGAFSSGKTLVVERLKALGYRTVPEAARELIDAGIARGMSVEEIRRDEAAFQEDVLERKIEVEQGLPRDEVIFFDRGIPDTLAYMRMGGFDEHSALRASRNSGYGKVFILDPLPFHQDYARTESREQMQVLDKLLEQCYRALGYTVIRIPVARVMARVRAILVEI